MYTIIKGDDEFGGGKVLSSSMGGGLLLQNDPSGTVFCDQREVLLDFTIKDHSSSIIPNGKVENSSKLKNHSYNRSDAQKIAKKDAKFQFNTENPVMSSNEGCYKGRVDSPYSQRINESAKDMSSNFISLNRVEKEDISEESPLQFNNCERIVFEDSQVKEIFSNLLIRKDVDTDRILMKEFENNSIFGSDNGMIIQGDKLVLNALPLSYMEKHSANVDDNVNETSLLLSSKQTAQEYCGRKNSLSSLIIEQGQNLMKKQLIPLSRHQERINLKSTYNTGALEQGRNNKPFIQYQNLAESKTVSPLDFSSEEIRIKSIPYSPLYFQEGLDELSGSQFGKQRLTENPHSYVLNQKFSHLKNLVPISMPNEEIKLNEVTFSNSPSEDSIELRDTQSPYCNSLADSQMDSFSISNHGELRLKSGSPLYGLTQEQINRKNASFIVALGQDLIKNDAISDSEVNRTLSHIALNREQLKIMASSSFARGSVPTKHFLPPPCDQQLYHSKLSPLNDTPHQEHEGHRKKTSAYPMIQLQLPLKNDFSIFEKAHNGFCDENINIKKSHPSNAHQRTIIQDSVTIKDVQASCSKHIIQENRIKNIISSPLVPQLKRVENVVTRSNLLEDDNKIKNFSFPIYDDCQKQSISEIKLLRENAFQLGESEVMDFRLKDGPVTNNSSLPNQASENLSFHSSVRPSLDGSNFLRMNQSQIHNDPAQAKESFQNHPSVIAQVGMSCKVCNSCRSFYFENGFLNGEESCALCLYHAKNDMKCVCEHSFIKEETCTCNREKYGCSYCNEKFPSILLLQRHTFIHISEEDRFVSSDRPCNEGSYTCSVCRSLFSTEASLEQHMSSHKENCCGVCNRTFKQFNLARHSCEARYTCNLCGAGFASNYNLKMHLLKHSGSLPYKCRDCNKSFAKPSELSKHSLVHSGERPYSCNECNMTFTSPTNLRSHKNTHSGRKPHLCQICNKSFTRPADVKRHMVIHTGARPYACEVCGLAFADASNMRKHLTTHSKPHQGSDIKTYHCTYCGKMFARPSELKRHFFTHTNTRPYACHICGLAFTDSSNLKKHIQTHERSLEQICLQCDANFKSFEELETHMSLTHGTKRFDSNSGHNCQTCGVTFSQLIDLQDHILSHGAASSYQCEICLKNFCEQVFLERHLLTHTESRPFICNECNKSFKSLSHLRSHILIHTGEKSHICLKCNKSFLKKSSLLRHQGVHAREKVLAMYQFA